MIVFRGFGTFVICEVDRNMLSPERLAQNRQLRRNFEWFKTHSREIYERHRGKFIYVAGEEVFVGDSPTEARSAAAACHPEDAGGLSFHIPADRARRVYVGHRRMG
jgi:hypothetical protein